MKTVIITHEVKNYSDWRKVYDADEVNRKKAGINLTGVYQSVNNPNLITLVGESPSVEAFTNFMANPKLKEAMAQDQALDAFEVFVRKKVEDHMAMAEHQIAELDAKIQALQTERARLAERIPLDQDKLREWRRRKRAYERDLAAAIGYLTDRPVITTDELTE